MKKLFLSIIACQTAGIIGSLFTFSSIPTWYRTLVKPVFSPPNWIFGPVWTTLYILMGVAMYMVWQKDLKHKNVRQAFNLFLIHLIVNAGWSIVFFGMRSISGGMLVITILWGLIIVIITKFYRINQIAAYLLIPYLFWVSFAAFLNFSLFLLN